MQADGAMVALKAGAEVTATRAVPAAPAAPACVPSRPSTATWSQARAAQAMSIRGVVVARELDRRALVVASPRGSVSTLRFATTREAASVPLGADVLSRALHLADGTFHSLALSTLGHASHARIRGIVVQSAPSHLVLSAGGSVFQVRRGSSAVGPPPAGFGAASELCAGSVVEASVAIGNDRVEQTGLQRIGQVGLLGLDGVLNAVGDGQIVVAVDSGALTTIAVPPSLSLPANIAVGDRVEVLVSFESPSFTLVTITDDSLAADAAPSGGAAVPAGLI